MNQRFMIYKTFHVFTSIFLLVMTISCSKKASDALNQYDNSVYGDPKDFNKLLEQKSYLTINYSLNKKGIKDTFQYFIDTYMTEPMSFPDYDLTAVMKRNASMNVEFEGRKVLIELPLSIFIKKKTFLGDIDAQGDLLLSLISEIQIDPYWQFSTKTQLANYTWTKKPKLNVGVSIPIETISNKIIERIKPEIIKSIDDNMRSGFDLKSKVQNVSNYTLAPYKLNEVYGGWMTTQVDTAYMGGVLNKKEETIGKITFAARTFISSNEPSVAPVAKTPIFSWKDKLPDSSKLNLQLDLAYSYLETIANENVKGKVFSEDGKKITINNVRITGDSQGRLVVNSDVYGSFNGTVLIKGKPYYDKSKKMLRASDIDVNIKTGNILHSAAAFLMKGKIKSEISKMLEFPLADKIADIQTQTDTYLNEYSKKNKVKATAKIGSMDIAAAVAEETRVRSLVTITFYLSTYLDNLSYFRQ